MLSTRRAGLRADTAAGKPVVKKPAKKKGKAELLPVVAGREIANSDFKVYLVGPGSKRLEVTQIVESIEWAESSDEDNVNSWPTMAATINVRQQEPDGYGLPDFSPGKVVDCYCQGTQVWRMRIVKPSSSGADGVVTIELQDEIRQLALPRGDFRYVANKSHKGGWSPDEIAKAVCKRYKIPYSKLLVMRVNGTGAKIRLAKVDKKKASPLSVIQYAYEEARKRSAHRYLMRWDFVTNKLEAVSMREGKSIYEFGSNQITDAQATIAQQANFATALRVTWYKPKPRKAGKKWKPKKQSLTFVVYKEGKVVYTGRGAKRKARTTSVLLPPKSGEVIAKYGYIERKVEFSAAGVKEARAQAQTMLAAMLRPKKTLTFNVAGEPNIRRGDFIRVNLPAQGFAKKQMWVQSVAHSVSDQYTMEVVARFDNPFSASQIKKERAAAARYKKAAEKKEKKAKGAGSGSSAAGTLLSYGERPQTGVVYTVGASTYGWTPQDDNGKDVLGNSLFSGNPSIGVMEFGRAMKMNISGGGRDFQRKVRVSWNGKSTIGYLRDVGNGDSNNMYQGRSLAVTGTSKSPRPQVRRPRVIDLHVRVAKELGWTPSPGIDLVNMEIL